MELCHRTAIIELLREEEAKVIEYDADDDEKYYVIPEFDLTLEEFINDPFYWNQ